VSRWYRWDGDDLILALRIQPHARRDGCAEVLGDSLQLRRAAPPVDGQGKARLIAFLADPCGVTGAAASIEAGARARRKRVRVQRPLRLPAPLGHAPLQRPRPLPGL
jgi:uncharacterized protein YggU (UPF0235/DUF167 family)